MKPAWAPSLCRELFIIRGVLSPDYYPGGLNGLASLDPPAGGSSNANMDDATAVACINNHGGASGLTTASKVERILS